MRILTIRQPWASAIAEGVKLTENRTRNIAGDYRGPVAIHAGAAWDNSAFAFPPLAEWAEQRWGITRATYTGTDLPTRSIIAVANMWAVHEAKQGAACCPNNERWTHWASPDGWHLCFAEKVTQLDERIPFKGALGLRELDQATVDAIEAQL